LVRSLAVLDESDAEDDAAAVDFADNFLVDFERLSRKWYPEATETYGEE
jgi:hypothetical protein